MPSTSTRRQSSTSTKRSRSRTNGKATRGNGRTDGEITTYNSALRWLYQHTDVERMRMVRYDSKTFSLDRVRGLLKGLGNPEQQVRAVHIAGSKGKGSTCAMLNSMLQACGYTVGSFTSPHLVDLRERITINGQMVSQSEMTELLKAVQSAAKKTDPPTFFEILTACGLKYFADQAVDIAILEVGLGGRLDSTNVITPLVCGITQISHDHTDILGKELTDIAREKAGIFKKGIPAISVEQHPDVAGVLRHVAEQVDAPLQFTGTEIEFSYRFEANRELGPHTRVCLTTPNHHYEHLPVPLQGEHQALNCGLALAILERLKDHGFEVPEARVIQGLARTRVDGRMEIVWNEPRILVDGAHNGVSMRALVKSIGAHVPYDSLVMIFGCASDKDVRGMLKEINLGADKVIFTRAKNNPRAMEPSELQQIFMEESDKMAQTADSLEEALNLAARAVSREDLICVTGSFYLIGETKKYLADLSSKRNKAAAAAAAN